MVAVVAACARWAGDFFRPLFLAISLRAAGHLVAAVAGEAAEVVASAGSGVAPSGVAVPAAIGNGLIINFDYHSFYKTI